MNAKPFVHVMFSEDEVQSTTGGAIKCCYSSFFTEMKRLRAVTIHLIPFTPHCLQCDMLERLKRVMAGPLQVTIAMLTACTYI